MERDRRSVRVFVSSTFRDMREERDELAKRTFVRLRHFCEERGVLFADIDLRWGITEEAAHRGEVLRICLEEIQECRPFFVGLLGERYGWVPPGIPTGLVAEHPWLSEHAEASVTELEILHGVLNDPEMASRSFFYFRDPSYAEARGKEFLSTDESERARLGALKQRIRASGLPVREGFRDSGELGDTVFADLSAAIEALFPADTEPSPGERERRIQEAFAADRRGGYVGRPEYLTGLDRRLEPDRPPLVVVGESGSGKSSLLAEWAAHVESTQPDVLCLTHFVGVSPQSADWQWSVTRLANEIASRCGLSIPPPAGTGDAMTLLTRVFHAAAARGARVVVIVDGLDALEERDAAPGLPWLPEELPSGITLVVSALPGAALDETKRRAWPQLQVHPLEVDERRQLLERYLTQHRKQLDCERVDRVIAAPQCAHPLFLKLMLSELCIWPEHDTLDLAIGRYLEASDATDLFSIVLGRFEEDYERDRPGLVGEAMSNLWASRAGLSETELLALLGDENPLPRAHFSPFYLAAHEWLITASGLLRFGRPELRAAVERRYLPTKEGRRAAHARLARYFGQDACAPRAIAELPWQLLGAEDWPALRDVLCDAAFLQALWESDRWTVYTLWTRLEAEFDLHVVDAYRGVLDSPHQSDISLSLLWELLTGMGYCAEALPLLGARLDTCRATGDSHGVHLALGDAARTLIELGRIQEAQAVLAEQERIGIDDGDVRETFRLLHHKAMIASALGAENEALELLRREEDLARREGDVYALSYALAGQADVLFSLAASRNDVSALSEVETLASEAERMSRAVGDTDGIAHALLTRASTRHLLGDPDAARMAFDGAEALYRKTGNRLQLARCLCQRSVSDRDVGDAEGSLARLKEAEALSRALATAGPLIHALCLQADVLQHEGQLESASAKAGEALALAREVNHVAAIGYAQKYVDGIRAKLR